MQRASGILLHPTALPGEFPVGDIGGAHRFVEFLARARQGVWQVLPLGPTGYGHSPYNALSAFAGNPSLIDLRQLVACGDLDDDRLSSTVVTAAAAGFAGVHTIKSDLLQEAADRFFDRPRDQRRRDYEQFCEENAEWLDDFTLFMALREFFARRPWTEWPANLRGRQPATLQEWRERLAVERRRHGYRQFVFAAQWQQLREHANRCGIRILGDIPIFVAHDSADVWANQELFQLDGRGEATAVAGVPPDYFSTTGQRWGNPLYRWDRHRKQGFRWWLQRFEHQLRYSDLIRIDHFRGFQACWSIPASEATAVNGRWVEVPGRTLFEELRRDRGELPIIAEDLGVITPDVEQLRDDFGFPGMKILQFAFDSGPDNPYLPEHHVPNSVVYTGTHDNDTTLGWWRKLTPEQRAAICGRLGSTDPDIPWALIGMAMASVANLCVTPCQDVLGLGSEARFNTPGVATGNWAWQAQADAFDDALADRLGALTTETGRATQQ